MQTTERAESSSQGVRVATLGSIAATLRALHEVIEAWRDEEPSPELAEALCSVREVVHDVATTMSLRSAEAGTSRPTPEHLGHLQGWARSFDDGLNGQCQGPIGDLSRNVWLLPAWALTRALFAQLRV